MSFRKLITIAFVLLVLSGLFRAMVREENPTLYTNLSRDKAPFSVQGPHLWVGTRDLVIDGEVPMEITLWYPAVSDESPVRGITYPYKIKMGDPLGSVAIASFRGQAIPDAPYDVSKSPYPLVILSPGFSIGVTAYAWLAEHLASYGFVVLSPEHQETLDPENVLWRTTITRPQEILSIFDFVDEQVGAEGDFQGLINPEHVGVIGHSFGGYTALAAAGAKLDTGAFNTHCKSAYRVSDPSAWLCDVLLPHLADMAKLSGLETIPNAHWPAWADHRVDAIVSMAGDAYFFGQTGLAEISVPVMTIGGTLDSDTPFSWGTHPTYEYVSSSKKVKIALNDAEHMIFTGSCEKIRWYLKFLSGEFCSDQFWDRSYAHMLIKHFTTAFLLTELKLDSCAPEVLVPDVVEFPKVIYDAKGY